MDLISTGGENLLDFPGLGEVLSSYEWDIKYGICLPQERPVPMRVTMGPLGIPLKTIPGPKTFCGIGVRASGVVSSADMDLGGTSGVFTGESYLVCSGGMRLRFPPEL